MSGKTHSYPITVEWTGNLGKGTADYRAYSRDHTFSAGGKPPIPGSSDPTFRGDPARWNPEDLLVASLSACHKLWYLHLCAAHGIVVTAYRDEAMGTMVEDQQRGGWFTEVMLRPQVTIRAGDDAALALRLHDEAHHKCFIANSVNFPVRCAAKIDVL
jgi:organic hydroperoxide reductase OsmC/OhrA